MVVAFDLDDTLFPEMDYVRSAYRAIAREFGEHYLPMMMSAATPAQAFDATGIDIDTQLRIYRTHFPDISLSDEAFKTLSDLKSGGHILAIITDGRYVTQMNKIKALGLDRFVDDDLIFISGSYGEPKLSGGAMRELMSRFPDEKYAYVGDNPEKDFVRANELGWITVALRAKKDNIFSQDFEKAPSEYRPGVIIDELCEIIQFVNNVNSMLK